MEMASIHKTAAQPRHVVLLPNLCFEPLQDPTVNPELHHRSGGSLDGDGRFPKLALALVS